MNEAYIKKKFLIESLEARIDLHEQNLYSAIYYYINNNRAVNYREDIFLKNLNHEQSKIICLKHLLDDVKNIFKEHYFEVNDES